MGKLFAKYVLRVCAIFLLPSFLLFLSSYSQPLVVIGWSAVLLFSILLSLYYGINNFKKIGITWKDLKDEHFKTSQHITFFTPLSVRQIVDEMHKNNYFDKAFYTFAKKDEIEQVKVEIDDTEYNHMTTMLITAHRVTENAYQVEVTSKFMNKFIEFISPQIHVNLQNIQELRKTVPNMTLEEVKAIEL